MKKITFVIVLSIISILSTSCYKRNGWGVRGKGENVTENRPINNFDRIQLSIDGDIEYTQDSAFKFEITGQNNILLQTTAEVKNGELKIFYKGNVWDHSPIKMRIYSPNIKGFSISGSGDITAMNVLRSESMNCSISGSGNIKIPTLQTGDVTANISGSGNISVDAGTLTNENFTISGSGNINCINFLSKKSNCKISGSGNIMTNVSEELSANISGSGDIKYKGRPAVTTQISGSGNLIHID